MSFKKRAILANLKNLNKISLNLNGLMQAFLKLANKN